MFQRRRTWAASAAVGTAVSLLPYVTGRAAPPSSFDPVPRRVTYEYGKDLFFKETFGGNGRTCGTCHDPRNEFTVSPELVRARYAADPANPLFRPVDSDDGAGRDYTTLLDLALFRVTITLAPNVVNVDDPSRRTITVRRAVPSIANVPLTAPYLADGRAPTLEAQALGAIADHLEPAHRPAARELVALKLFENEILYPQRIRSLTDDNDPLPKEPGFTLPLTSPAAIRGKSAFDRHCRSCHGGELLDHPEDPGRSRFANVFVSDVNRPELPVLRLAFTMPDGTVGVAETPDPGRAAITGDLADLNAFDTPALRGVKHTAPYFHDNSAATLGDVVEHYDQHFQFQMTAAEKEDLVVYLEAL